MHPMVLAHDIQRVLRRIPLRNRVFVSSLAGEVHFGEEGKALGMGDDMAGGTAALFARPGAVLLSEVAFGIG